MKKDSLGDRMKAYEAAYNHKLTPKSCLFIRVDGKAFHTFTKGCEKPFDNALIDAMNLAAHLTVEQMMGFKMAYIQSDECTFMLTDFDKLETQGWFGYELNKVVSITASLFTGYFNQIYSQAVGANPNKLAFFDARAFIVPLDDAPNVFVWRQQDWYRNSVSMLAQANFSHKELIGKNIKKVLDLLRENDILWNDLPDKFKYGTFIFKRPGYMIESDSEYKDYDNILETLNLSP